MTDKPVAQFTRGHTVRTHDEGLDVLAPDGARRATFHGAHRAVTDRGGHVQIFAEAPLTRDEARLLSLQDELRRINSVNQEFWAARKVDPQ